MFLIVIKLNLSFWTNRISIKYCKFMWTVQSDKVEAFALSLIITLKSIFYFIHLNKQWDKDMFLSAGHLPGSFNVSIMKLNPVLPVGGRNPVRELRMPAARACQESGAVEPWWSDMCHRCLNCLAKYPLPVIFFSFVWEIYLLLFQRINMG